MDPFWKSLLWRQFEASIEMLESALRACPDELWAKPMWGEHSDRPDLAEFWYIAYHTLFWLDLYLTGAVEGFAPPPPFTLDELDPAGLVPETAYPRDTLLDYLGHCRQKCRDRIEGLTDESARRLCRLHWGEVSYVELLLDNMRHVQEHAAQLNMFLGQGAGAEARWVSRGKRSDEA